MNEYGLIGYPLEHSFSKEYFTSKFEKEGLNDACFNLFPLRSVKELTLLLHTHKHLKGLAVTIPYKEQVVAYLTDHDAAVQSIGAVNCIRIRGNELKGFNTDTVGFQQSFLPLLQPHHTKALILGNGGASKAVQYVLKNIKMPFLIVTRHMQKEEGFIGYEFLDEQILKAYPVIINCTPLGMYPNENTKPLIPYHFLSAINYLYDLVYKPEETMFLKEGRRAGALVKNGFEMLLIQAEENWKIWNRL